MEWKKNETGYNSEDERFHISKCTDRINSGNWEIWDDKKKEVYFQVGYTLKHAKQIANSIIEREE